jgi:hypothetical protein
MDLGSTIANIVTVPIQVPRFLHGALRLLMNGMVGAYYRTYGRMLALDDSAVRYHQVFRAMSQLVRFAERFIDGRANLGVYGSGRGIRRLLSHVRRIRTAVGTRLGSFAVHV